MPTANPILRYSPAGAEFQEVSPAEVTPTTVDEDEVSSPSPIITYPGGLVPGEFPPPSPLPGTGITNADVTQLVNGQSYIDVVFDHIQTDTDWIFVECSVFNTVDAEPLNIWPGIITEKTTTGFRLQLNGMPDTDNYFLSWAISGINIVPTPATTFILSGPASGVVGASNTFTVRLPSSTTGTAEITPSDGGDGGTFIPATVTLNTGGLSTFAYIPATAGTKTISVTNDGGLLNPDDLSFLAIVYATGYSMSGPSAGYDGIASADFTFTLTPLGDPVPSTVTVTPDDGGDGGTFTPTTVELTTAAPSDTFTYMAASVGAKTISATNDGGLTDPGNLTYTASAFDPIGITGLKGWWKADALALSDGALVNPWTDSSGNGYDLAASGFPTYKTNIVNSKSVVRFDGIDDRMATAAIAAYAGSGYTVFVVASAASVSAGSHEFLCAGTALSGDVLLRRDGADLNDYQYTGSGFTNVVDTGGITAGAWNLITIDWTGTNMRMWRNSVSKGTTAVTAIGHTITTIFVGSDNAFTNYFDGDIAEVLIYAVSLSTGEREAVEAYLKGKYGIP